MSILEKFDTVKSSESGSWIHLVVPGTDDFAYNEDGTPLRLKLKGPDSKVWVSFQRKAIRGNTKKDTRSVEDIAMEDAQLFAKMTLDMENIEGFEPEYESLVSLYIKYKDIRMQVMRFVMNQENFTREQLAD